MYNTRSTFNRIIKNLAEPGIPVHFEPQEVTAWPSYRVTWLSVDPDTRTAGMRALVQVDINVNEGQTAVAWKRADALQKALGLARYQSRPKFLRQDWTDPRNPVDQPDIWANWVEYGLRFGMGWRFSGDDPLARTLSVTLELFFNAD